MFDIMSCIEPPPFEDQSESNASAENENNVIPELDVDRDFNHHKNDFQDISETKPLFSDTTAESIEINPTARDPVISKPETSMFVSALNDLETNENEEITSKPDTDSHMPAQLSVTETDELDFGSHLLSQPPVNETFQSLGGAMSNEESADYVGDYDITITVGNPEKVGDGINAFMIYPVTSKTSIPTFKEPEVTVRRRFSDFLKLHEHLEGKHIIRGRIVPPPPEKSVQTLTKVKMTKQEASGENEFFLKRRFALERYLNRIARHPVLIQDTNFRQFLESTEDLPHAKDTSYISGAGIMKMMKNVSGQFSKMSSKMTETDMWYEMKLTQIDTLEMHLKKLHSAIETLVNEKRNLCNSGGKLASNLALLSQAEDNTAVASAISQLSELEHKLQNLNEDQWKIDYFIIGELARDYISLIGSIKNCFGIRIKSFQTWQHAQNMLMKKREQELKLQGHGKAEKVIQVQAEIKSWEVKVQESQDLFDALSKNIRTEVDKFEKERALEFKQNILKYLKSLTEHHEKVLICWQDFQPEAQNI